MTQPLALAPIEWDVVDLVESIGAFEIAGFFDLKQVKDPGPFPILGTDADWPRVKAARPDLRVAVLIDPPPLRERLFAHYGPETVTTLISPFAHVSPWSSVGTGSMIQREVLVMPRVSIGRGCNVNIRAVLHHEVQVSDFCTVGPGAFLLGAVVLEKYAYIGAGAVIRQNVRVGEGAKVGAGAVVVADVAPGETVVGVPARPITDRG